MGLPVQHDVSGLWGIVQSSGPSGKFCNAQPRHKHCGQGAVRREWQALSKGCNTAHDACGAALREPLCECDSVLRFLPREGPLPAKRALIRTRTVALNVTELSTWPTSVRSVNTGKQSSGAFDVVRVVFELHMQMGLFAVHLAENGNHEEPQAKVVR